MSLAERLAETRAGFQHAAETYNDDAMTAYLAGPHAGRLGSLPPCETSADAIALAEELAREDTDDDMGSDRATLAGLLITFLRPRG